MQTFKTILVVTILIIFSSCLSSLAQEKKIYTGEIPVRLTKDNAQINTSEKSLSNTEEMTALENKMKRAKESGDRNQVINLQKQVDAISGAVTRTPREIKMKRLNPEDFGLDNIYINNIFSTNDQFNIRDIATATSHRGSHSGRIWTVWIAFEQFPVQNASSLGLAYSDDHGLTWTVQYLFAMEAIEDMATLDIEIVEDNVNNSFIWIVFNPNVLAIVNLNTGASNAYALNWGTATNTQTLHPRIVSDNAAYPDIPYIYIIAQHWTLLGSDPNIYSVLEMTAKCVSPFTVTPIVSFGSNVDYPENAVYTIPDYTTDIAYFRNGSNDSLVILINNSGSEMKILTHSIFSFGIGLGRYIGNLNPQSNTIPEQRAYMATNGAFNKIMVVFKRRYSINDWDIAYYKSTLGTGGWVNGYIDFSGYDAYGDARIIGERNNPGKFHVAYQRQIFSQISYCSSINYTWNSPIFPFSDTRSYAYTGPDLGNPAPGYSTLINEPCFAVWIDSTGKNVKSSAGCSGSFLQPTKKLFMFGAIQGLYNNMTDLMIYDTVTVYLRNAVSPFAKIDSSKKELYGPGTGQYFSFNNAQNGTPYYVEVKHRNALETWSADPVSFVSDATSIAFSVDDTYAYGNNEIQVDNSPYNVFAFYSGDVNQDGFIDLTDVLTIYNDANNFLTGYVVTDLTGDSIVDLTDLLIAYNNSVNFVSVIKP